VLANKTNKDRLMFCSDGLDPIDITKFGHIDHCIREAVKLGLNLTDAISMLFAQPRKTKLIIARKISKFVKFFILTSIIWYKFQQIKCKNRRISIAS